MRRHQGSLGVGEALGPHKGSEESDTVLVCWGWTKYHRLSGL